MKSQAGLSLVELMIALLLGSLLTAAATQLFLVNRQTENLQAGIAGVQDNGRFAFDYVSRSLMEAGQHPAEPTVPFILEGSGFNSATPLNAEIADGDKYDVISFAVTEGRDCFGNDFTGYKMFSVGGDGNSLRCSYFSQTTTDDDDGNPVTSWGLSNASPIIDNVKAFQVLYGVDFDGPEDIGYGMADVYTNATRVKALASSINSGQVRIVSVRFAVLVASQEVVTLDTSYAPDSITVLDHTYSQGSDGATELNFEDGKLHRTYSSTVALRNLVSGI